MVELHLLVTEARTGGQGRVEGFAEEEVCGTRAFPRNKLEKTGTLATASPSSSSRGNGPDPHTTARTACNNEPGRARDRQVETTWKPYLPASTCRPLP